MCIKEYFLITVLTFCLTTLCWIHVAPFSCLRALMCDTVIDQKSTCFLIFFWICLQNSYYLCHSEIHIRKVIHTVGPKYAIKYHTAAENALSHCYRSCLELLIENGLQRLALNIQEWSSYWLFMPGSLLQSLLFWNSIAMGCIYTEAKNYPREPAAHVAISK